MSNNALYVVGGPHDWISIARNLRDRNVLLPKYWIGSLTNKETVKKEFPDVAFHSHNEALRSIPAADFEEIENKAIDSNTLEQYDEYTYTIFRTMDRIDPKYCFNYDERTRHYHRLLSYWITVLEERNIDTVVFPISPLHTYSYVLYAVCKEKDIQTVILTNTKLPDMWFVREDVDEMPSWQTNHEAAELSELSDSSREYLINLREKNVHGAIKPSDQQNTTKSLLFNVKSYPRYLLKLNENVSSFYKRRGELPENSNKTWGEYILHKFKTNIRKKKLEKCYNSLSMKPKYSENYIYIPLHYQPERSSVPEGGVYSTQKLMVELLAHELPDDWKIFVKEHPKQFHTFKQGEHSRSQYHYKDLDKIENVSLVDLETNSSTLIDNAKAVATLTGTAGWEAIVRDVPALIYGNAWYRNCNAVFDVKSVSETREALSEIEQSDGVSKFEDIVGFAKQLNDHGFRSHNHVIDYENHEDLPPKKIVTNTCDAIADFITQ